MRNRSLLVVLGTVLALSGCGGGTGTGTGTASSSVIPTNSAPESPTSTITVESTTKACGELQMKGNAYKAVILKGHPACPLVIKTFHAFFAAAKSGGKAKVSGWACAYKSPAVMKKTKIVAECAKKGEAIAAKA